MSSIEFVNLHRHPSEVVVEIVERGQDIDLEVFTVSFRRLENGKVQCREEIPSKYEERVRSELDDAGFELV